MENCLETKSTNEWITITRRIQLIIDIPKEKKDELSLAYRKLYDWQSQAYKISNIITSHLFFEEHANEFIYLKDNLKLKIADNAKEIMGMLNTSRENSTYRIISKKYKNQLPSSITVCLNHSAYKNYSNEKIQCYEGERSLRSYKKNSPVPFCCKSIFNLHYDTDIKEYRFTLFKHPKYSIPFQTYLGREKNNSNRVTLNKIIKGEYKLCSSSSYKINEGKITLILNVKIPQDKTIKLDPEKIVYAKLSFLTPIKVRTDGAEDNIGDKGSYVHKRIAFQHGLARRQKIMKYNKGGRGRTKKMKGTEEFKSKEKLFIKNYMDILSSDLIRFCVNNKAGKLILEDFEKLTEETKEFPTILRNWSFSGLRDKIVYKCKINNIELIQSY